MQSQSRTGCGVRLRQTRWCAHFGLWVTDKQHPQRTTQVQLDYGLACMQRCLHELALRLLVRLLMQGVWAFHQHTLLLVCLCARLLLLLRLAGRHR
jgi:hypothetical protein